MSPVQRPEVKVTPLLSSSPSLTSSNSTGRRRVLGSPGRCPIAQEVEPTPADLVLAPEPEQDLEPNVDQESQAEQAEQLQEQEQQVTPISKVCFLCDMLRQLL